MTQIPISRFPLRPADELPADLAERYAEVQEKSGFLPNVFAALAWRPDEARAFFAMHDALMDKDTPGLSKADRELIVVATSAGNDCLYCVVAHGAVARVRTKDPHIADHVAVDWRKAPLSPRMHAVLAVATRLAADPAAVTADDLAGLAEHGLTQDDVWDVGMITSFFALSNRLAHFAAITPNPEFFLMGRLPRSAEPARDATGG
ncbi:peroxidase-related enzyme [Blastococcus sp. VKM Ac-2987]|uniref:peroxidase-related enzyme n=1 Tax=Blastococcus sp. VKM Ac-2987 TaxID=3004141 RepID=UPI0022ABA538|nr:peroxidase-related enzyme [Blastococcus sp. VKM Ac-2987]MCZ2860552.1 peroxidase-related enzyme [Blastococcus sp. VKM Ac-2987]